MKYFEISYERNNVPQAIIIKAESHEAAESVFKGYKPDAIIAGVTEKADITNELRKGMPIVTAK